MKRYNSRITTIVMTTMILQFQYIVYPTITFILCAVTAVTTTNNNTTRYTRNNFHTTERELKKYYNKISKRIVGGSIVPTSTKYPWFTVSAGRELCGSTLIHPDILLTAAHCSGAFILNGVMIGGILLNGTDPTMQYSTVVNEFYHSQYNESMNLMNDIMLVKLSKPISTDTTTKPIQYNTDKYIPIRLDIATILGYGLTAETNSTASSVLLDTNINIVPYEYCKNLFQYLDNDRMICAGVSDGSNDACQGDSGGPLIIENEANNNKNQQESTYTQIGITSFGIGCGRPNMPAVYTRVSYYQNWIIDGICTISSVPFSDPTICSNVKGSFIYNITTQNTTTTTPTPTAIPTIIPTTSPTITTIQASSSKPTITSTSQTQNTLIPTMSPTKLQQQPSVSTIPSSSVTAPIVVLSTQPILQNVTSFNPTKIPSPSSSSPSSSSSSSSSSPSSTTTTITTTVQPSSTKAPTTTTRISKQPSVVPINTTNSPTTIIKSKTPIKSSLIPPLVVLSVNPSISVSSNTALRTASPKTTIQQKANQPTISPSTSLGGVGLTIEPSLDLTYRPISQGMAIPSLHNMNSMRNRNQRWKLKCIFLSIARKKNASSASILDTTSATASINDKDGEKKYNGMQVPQTTSSLNEIMEKNRNIKTEKRMMVMRRHFRRKNTYDDGSDFNTTTMELARDELKKIEMDERKKNNETYSSTQTIKELPKSTNQTTDGSFNSVDEPFGHAKITSDEEAAYQNKATSIPAEKVDKTISSPPISISTDSNVFLKRVSSQRVP